MPRCLQLLHVQSFKLFKSSSISTCLSYTNNLYNLAKHQGRPQSEQGCGGPSGSVSTSSGRIQGMTLSASNAAGVLLVTHHSILEMLYRSYIPQTTHTVDSPGNQGKSIPASSGLISQCQTLNKSARYTPQAAWPHSHKVFIFFV